MRRCGGLLLCGLSLISSGCAIVDISRDMVEATVDMFRPDERHYAEPVDDTDWSIAGREGRGDRPRDHESDGWTKWWTSEKANSINRNVGYD